MKRPRPIRMLTAILTGANAIALSIIPVLQSFGTIEWTGQQVGLVEAMIGTLTTAGIGVIAAWQGNGGLTKLQSALNINPTEGRVTPVADPRDDGLAPLVPIANDSYED